MTKKSEFSDRYTTLLDEVYTFLEKHCQGVSGSGRSLAINAEPFSRVRADEILNLAREDHVRIRSDLEALAKIYRLANAIQMDVVAGVGISIRDLCLAATSRLTPRLVEVKDVDGLRDNIFLLLVYYLHDCGVPDGGELYAFAVAIMIYSSTEDQKIHKFAPDEETDVFGWSRDTLEGLQRRQSRRLRKIATQHLEKSTRDGADKSVEERLLVRVPGTLVRGTLLRAAKRAENNPRGREIAT